MCGRYAITLPPEAMRAVFRYVEQPNFPPRYNIAPTQPVPIVRLERDSSGLRAPHFVLVRWGFIPSFVKDPKDFPLVFNARSETVIDKPSYRYAMKRRRCIFIADAFYEWQRSGTKSSRTAARPYLIRRRDSDPMGLAGIWETWSGPNGEESDTACILTTSANGLLAGLHDRMPVVLERESFDTWLDCDDVPAEQAMRLLKPADDSVLEYFEIGSAVNKADNENAEVQLRVSQPDRAEPPQKDEAPQKVQGELF